MREADSRWQLGARSADRAHRRKLFCIQPTIARCVMASDLPEPQSIDEYCGKKHLDAAEVRIALSTPPSVDGWDGRPRAHVV